MPEEKLNERKWNLLHGRQVVKELESRESGLSAHEAAERLKKYGPNKLMEEKKRSAVSIFLAQFKSFLIVLLILATVLSAAIGNFLDAAAIAVILFLNAILGFWQEFKAEKSLQALKKYAAQKSIVLRNGEKTEVLSEEIVPGDIVILEEGMRIPADIRLLESYSLHIDESALTGESTPVEKITQPVAAELVAEQKCMAFMGTAVTYGRGKGIIVATGMQTEIGKIAKMIEQVENITPLQRKLEQFGKRLGYIVAMLAILIFAAGILQQMNTADIALTSIALAVAVVPEGLPAVVTITLAVGTQVMSRRNAIVRRLASIETLGSVTVICADKTGTMTTNEMTVRKVWAGKEFEVTGSGFEPVGKFLHEGKEIIAVKDPSLALLLRAGSLCNNAELRQEDGSWKIFGDPTEGSLVVLARKAGFKISAQRLDEMPFSSSRKMMSTVDKIDGNTFAHAKGAPEVIFEKCGKIYADGRIRQFSLQDKKELLGLVENYAKSGLRTLALTYKEIEGKNKAEESDLILIGIVGMMDPPRPEVKNSVEIAKQAGIRIVMITGDHAETAKAIGREVGIADSVITGNQLEKMSAAELAKVVDKVSIYARVSPLDKVKILQALSKKNNIVAMTGDGVNDAPALKDADIGVAMGRKGTDVAREVSDMVLTDDNFATIVSAVDEGRGIYANIKKFVRFLLAVNFAEMLFIVGAMLMRLPLPLLPLQILWINLVTDGLPALALAVDPKDKDIMKRKPRDPKETILHGEYAFLVASAIIALAVAMFAYVTELPLGVERARTFAFTTIIMFELFFVFNCREIRPLYRTNMFSNRMLVAAVLVSILLQLLVIYFQPLQQIFDTVPLTLNDWAKILALSATGFLVFPNWFIRSHN